MNWHMIISALVVVLIKVVGMTLFLLYFPQIFGQSSDAFIPASGSGVDTVPDESPSVSTGRSIPGVSVATVPEIFGSRNDSISPTRSYGRVCPKDWDLHQGRCFFLSTSELSWNKSRDDCQTRGSTLAIVNTPEKLEYLQDLAGAEKYLIGLMYQPAQKRWRWIDNSVFNGNVTNQHQNFNCVTIGLSKTFDAASCDVTYRWICEKNPV